MTRVIKTTSQYKRDLKHYRRDVGLLRELTGVIAILSSDVPLDGKYRDHDLHGDWEGCRECHVRPDALEEETIKAATPAVEALG